MRRLLRRLLLRPSLWAGLVAVIAYWDDTALHGDFVYDDAGSVKRNVVVTGQVPWTDVLRRDFWGTRMVEAQSHKSYRPVTTATFKLNWLLAEHLATLNNTNNDNNNTQQQTYWFHVVNVLLHGLVTLVLVEVCRVGGGLFASSPESQLLIGFLFGLHPVHAEAVSNITSRGELLMSLFFLLAIWSACAATTTTRATNNKRSNNADSTEQDTSLPPTSNMTLSTLQVYVLPWLCMACSMFSKEQGATTLIAVVLVEFIDQFESLQHLGRKILHKDAHALSFVGRTLLLALQTCALCALRYYVNGETKPDFIPDQNPAGFAPDRFTRIFSVNWVYCLYIWDAIWPQNLCPDWSGRSIELIETWNDVRVLGVLLSWVAVAMAIWNMIMATSHETFKNDAARLLRRKQALTAFWAFVVTPFLLSSNLLVVVGLMKADRVIYLPLAGLCMLQAVFIEYIIQQKQQPQQQEEEEKKSEEESSSSSTTTTTIQDHHNRQQHQGWHWLVRLGLFVQLACFCRKLHERNLAWSSSELLWMEAYRINPISYHTMYNYGYELSLRRKFHLAEEVLRPIANPHVNGPSNTFVYALVLQNLDRCDEANAYMDRALAVAEQQRNAADKSNIRQTDSSYVRVKSNLLVARALCTKNVGLAGKIMYEAVQADPTNEYAVEQAKHMLQHYERLQKQQELYAKMMANERPQL